MAASKQNGQPTPCEPCRKSKSRCDYATPVCKKCARKGKSGVCVYNAAQATQSWYSSNDVTAASPPQTNSDLLLEDKLSQLPPRGSLGLTSYSGVFSENNEDDLGGFLRNGATNGFRSAPVAITPKQTDLGTQLLVLLFENAPVLERAIESFREISPESCILDYRLIRTMLMSVKNMYDACTRDAKDTNDVYSNMRGWSQKLFDNGSKPVGVNSSMTPEEYIIFVSARWEGIGLLFSVLGQGAMLSRSIFELEGNSPGTQKSLGAQAAAASDTCLQFCDDSGIIDDSLGWLLFQHIHLLTLVYGENDNRAWRKLAELSTAVFTLNRNQSQQIARIPFFLVELRRRLMAGAYSIDKQLATFLGRPPQISWRYYDVQLPLDLGDDELLAEPQVRDAIISKLDASGWNTQGIVRKAVQIRFSLLMSSVREQILELALSRHVDNLPQKVKEVSLNSHRTWDELPSFLHWRPGAVGTKGHGDIATFYLTLLYNDFLLYRTLVKRAQSGQEGLVTISQDILNTVLELICREIGSGTGSSNVGWNASTFGIPAAGVLAIELLRQSEFGTQLQSSAFRRSQIIQNLSVFASHLQYVVRPHERHYDSCQHARKVICNILNRVLSVSGSALPFSLPAGVIAADWLNGESILLDDGTDFIDWVDSLDMNVV
ncbi:hypothetical protein ASPWEDRAFT_39302 [Aspergillus wentii DTO 134E9]|uniref:Zn(2)-C6 fungal-type domain-containing protein n=1 Tax=Aspergillus wentii DTO 134E9 TaxID=1073089 RepID=A0A1L9RRN8_ASPWE|nr:uncharacterized protein ASPWEDRAFT_39302 [Aspergillus wentii DTO 134E9]KAI9930419.1 hypothetical protein MW887_011173 [Aspergillus wentii]OJJ37579.1 hypothetical protein ASPWEDRAFT_39302 [Aspergillus wentii DTO 134E9]